MVGNKSPEGKQRAHLTQTSLCYVCRAPRRGPNKEQGKQPFSRPRKPRVEAVAIYHLSAKIISRKSGRSATAAAAYRAAERIVDERTGEAHDYTQKRGIEHAEIVLPAGVNWTPDRAELWNAVEAKNKRADAQVAREFVVALPDELTPEARRGLAVQFAREIADTYRVATDVAIHAPSREGDNRNHHAHILTSTNTLNPDGSFGNKARALDAVAHDRNKGDREAPNEIERLRGRWADLANGALEQAGSAERIDHRSLAAQGADREPTRHLGPAVSGMVRRGENSEVAIRIGEQYISSLYSASAIDRIERELDQSDRSIRELSGGLAKAIEERDNTPHPGLERDGPRITGRFNIKAKNEAREREQREKEAEREREQNDPFYRREKAERKLLEWNDAVMREKLKVVKQIRADTLAKGRPHVEKWQAHIDNKPLLFFGERARVWQKLNDEMDEQDGLNRRRLREINEKSWPANDDARLVIQQAAEQAAAKNPELARQAKAAQALINEEKRQAREREIREKALEQFEREQERKAKKDHGISR